MRGELEEIRIDLQEPSIVQEHEVLPFKVLHHLVVLPSAGRFQSGKQRIHIKKEQKWRQDINVNVTQCTGRARRCKLAVQESSQRKLFSKVRQNPGKTEALVSVKTTLSRDITRLISQGVDLSPVGCQGVSR